MIDQIKKEIQKSVIIREIKKKQSIGNSRMITFRDNSAILMKPG